MKKNPPIVLFIAINCAKVSSCFLKSIPNDINENDETSILVHPPILAHNTEIGLLTFPLLPHHHVVERRRRELRDLQKGNSKLRRNLRKDEDLIPEFRQLNRQRRDDIPPSGILYQGYGTHYVDLWVGTPPQRQTLIVDTGSSVTAFPCQGCTECGSGYHVDSYFQNELSTSFSSAPCNSCSIGFCSKNSGQCTLFMRYQEGSRWFAFEAEDLSYFGGPHNRISDGRVLDSEVEKQEATQKDDQSSLTIGNITSANQNGDVITQQMNTTQNVYNSQDVNAQKEIFEDEVTEAKETTVNMKSDRSRSASDYAFKLKFGCQTFISGLFKTQLADGIMGMENSSSSFWSQMYQSGMIPEKKFAICYNRSPVASRLGSGAGVITLGGADKALHKTDMVYAQNMKEKGWYTVYITAIYLKRVVYEGDPKGEQEMIQVEVDVEKLNRGGIIIDSGTTDSYFSRDVETPFIDAWKDIMGKAFVQIVQTSSSEEINSLPSILIQLKGAVNVDDIEFTNENGDLKSRLAGAYDFEFEDMEKSPHDIILEIPPSHYMEYEHEKKAYENRLHMTESHGGVLGANFIMGHDVLFDSENNRIGFAESGCDYNALIEKDSEEDR